MEGLKAIDKYPDRYDEIFKKILVMGRGLWIHGEKPHPQTKYAPDNGSNVNSD